MGLFSSVSKGLGAVSDFIKGNSALFDFAGPLISGGLALYGQNSANAANIALANSGNAFQALMRATQYQTAVKDMIAAGLNPMLAYQQGGAGNLSGATSPQIQNGLGQFVSTAMQARQLNAQIKQQDAQIEQTKASTQESKDRARFTRQQTMTEVAKEFRETQAGILDKLESEARMRLMAAQVRNFDATTASTALRTSLDSLDYHSRYVDDRVRRSWYGTILRGIGTGLSDLVPARNLFSR